MCTPGELERAVRSAVGAHVLDHGQLTGGVDAVVDCVGSEQSIAQAVRVCAPGGTVHLVGMPGVTSVDLTPVWQREIALRGAYAYEVPSPGAAGGPAASGDDFATAIDLVRRLDLGRLVTTTYPLSRYEDAIAHAAEAGTPGRGEGRLRPSRRTLRCPAPDSCSTSTARRRRSCSTTGRASGSRSCPPAAAACCTRPSPSRRCATPRPPSATPSRTRSATASRSPRSCAPA